METIDYQTGPYRFAVNFIYYDVDSYYDKFSLTTLHQEVDYEKDLLTWHLSHKNDVLGMAHREIIQSIIHMADFFLEAATDITKRRYAYIVLKYAPRLRQV